MNKTYFLVIVLLSTAQMVQSQITDTGDEVGIGTSNPISKLSVSVSGGTASYPTISSKGNVLQTLISNNNIIEIGNSVATNDRKAWILARHSLNPYGKYYSSLHLQPDIGDKSQYRGVSIGYESSQTIPIGTHLSVNGKVGIGTLNPDALLSVKGNIHAEEVKVDLSVPGPDYVFKEGYDLRSLEDVQNYIKKHGHLPNIPSAKEMEEEGVQLGKMNMKLLEKIEELTLYTLQQEEKLKRMENLEQEVKIQKEEIENLKSLIKNLHE